MSPPRTILILTACLLLGSGAAGTPAKHVACFPLSKGTTWIYAGKIEWTTEPNIVHKKTLRWKSEVIEVSRSKGKTVAILHGFPYDLAWFNGEKGYYVIIEDATCVIIKDARSEENARSIAREFRSRAVNAKTDDPFLRFPLRDGECVGDDGLPRSMPMYCNHVERIKDDRGESWEILYRSNPDHAIHRVVRGIGIVDYQYVHHGTVSNADVHLVSFKER